MNNNEIYNSINIEIENISPIFIGSGLELSSWEYIITKPEKSNLPNTNFVVRVMDLGNFASLEDFDLNLLKLNIDKLMVSLKSQIYYNKTIHEAANLNELYKQNHANHSFVKFIDKCLNVELICFPKITLDSKFGSIKLFAGYPECFIPGSSIKGALRTAIFNEEIQDSVLLDFYKNFKKYDKFSGNSIYKFYQKYFKPNQAQFKLNLGSPYSNFQLFKIRDSGNITIDNFRLVKIRTRFSVKNNTVSALILKRGFNSIISLDFNTKYCSLNQIIKIFETTDKFYRSNYLKIYHIF